MEIHITIRQFHVWTLLVYKNEKKNSAIKTSHSDEHQNSSINRMQLYKKERSILKYQVLRGISNSEVSNLSKLSRLRNVLHQNLVWSQNFCFDFTLIVNIFLHYIRFSLEISKKLTSDLIRPGNNINVNTSNSITG